MGCEEPGDADRLPVAPARVVWRTVLVAWGQPGRTLAPLVVVLGAAAALGTVPALMFGMLVDIIDDESTDVTRIAWLGAGMAAAIVGAAVLDGVAVVWGARLLESSLARMRERMIDSAFALPQDRVERAGSGDLISRAGDDVAVVADAISEAVPAIAISLFTILASVTAMAFVDIWYAVALLATTPIHVLAVRRYLHAAPRVYAAERAAMAVRAQRLLESLYGLGTIRAYGLQGLHAHRIASASWDVVRWSVRAVTVQNAFFARLNLAELIGMSSLLVVSFVLVDGGRSTIGAATAAMLLFLRLFNPINALLFVTDRIQSAYASLARIAGVIDVAPSASPTSSSLPEASPLAFEGVSFAYANGHTVLNAIDLTVADGEVVAVVGASGAGKSTIAGLAAGIHQPSSGVVRRPPDPREVVLVTQEVYVFAGTLRDNLTISRPEATDDEVVAALSAVGASGLLSADVAGLDVHVGAGGMELTPAQAQLVALARVSLARPQVVILDEPTAEAGSTDAGRLDRAAASVLRGRTGLIVTHRLSQARSADRIVVVDGGCIVERGTHAELVTAGGPYERLVRAAG